MSGISRQPLFLSLIANRAILILLGATIRAEGGRSGIQLRRLPGQVSVVGVSGNRAIDRFSPCLVGFFLPRRSVESLFRAIAMAKRLYVGNLKYTVTSAELQELFEQYGTVSSAQVLSDRETGRSRGFGFVEMVNDDEALAAIESLDGQDHDGRRLTVNEARPRTPNGGGGGGGGYRGGGGGGYRGGGGGGGYGDY